MTDVTQEPETQWTLEVDRPFEMNLVHFEVQQYGTEVASAYPDAKAYVLRDNGTALVLSANQAGAFQRVYVDRNEAIRVAVQFPDTKPGERIAITVLDGGTLPNGDVSGLATVDGSGRVQTVFTASQWKGTHRISFQKSGAPQLVADFWAGEENHYRSLN
jgi:hypothetical protein